MNANEERFARYEDVSGEAYYCPVGDITASQSRSDQDLDGCVEVSTVRRYSGHLNVVEDPK